MDGKSWVKNRLFVCLSVYYLSLSTRACLFAWQDHGIEIVIAAIKPSPLITFICNEILILNIHAAISSKYSPKRILHGVRRKQSLLPVVKD